jgi:type IV pilus assembly protein PilB
MENAQPQISSDETKKDLEAKLAGLKNKKIEEEVQQKSFILGLPYIMLQGIPIPPETLKLIDEQVAKEKNVVAFLRDEKKINLAILDLNPAVTEIKDNLVSQTGLRVDFYLISEQSLNSALKLYQNLPHLRQREKSIEINEEELIALQNKIKSLPELQNELQKSQPSEIISLIIATAIKSKASDIHLEAEENDVKVRLRIDGVLHDVASFAKNIWTDVASRIKLLSNLKINVQNQPQDGHFPIFFGLQKIDVRVSVLPSSFGESIVIRLLMLSQKITLEGLGFRKKYLEILKKEIERPNGMIITTGPTGAGKSTTLYAILAYLNKPENKVITLEEPVEYELPGATQISIDTSKGQNFAKMFRSVMRQDPDIIMVGEIRDQETAETAIQAALTGHLVLSTLHTNDAAGAIPRFLVLGVKPYLLAPALRVVLAQRLVRKICDNCKEEIQLAPEVLEKVNQVLADLPEEEKSSINLNQLKFYRGHGCETCQNIGYRDRIGIFEFFTVTPEIEKLILKASMSEQEIKEMLRKQKMITMIQDGVLKCLEGITSIEEVFRVTD